MLHLFLLTDAAGGADAGSQGSLWPTLIMIAIMVLLFYFLMYRPQKKQEKEAQQLRDSLAIGDEVTTIGGIVGKIVAVHEETVIIETSRDKCHIRLLRRAIGSIDVKAEDSVVPVKAKEEAPAKEKGKKGKKAKIEAAPVKDEPTLEEPTLDEPAFEQPTDETHAE